MKGTRLGSRYAKSLIKISLEQGKLEETYQDMKLFRSVIEESRDLEVVLKSPVIKTDKKISILNEIFTGKVSEITITLFEIITRKKREKYLLDVADSFVSQYNKHKNILTAIVKSANGLDDKMRARVMEIVRGSSDSSSVELQEEIDSDLIGGFILRIGDKEIDSSIKHKLLKLRMEFKENPFVKEY